jgi:hypothetical protein
VIYMDSPVNLIGPGDVEELAEMIGNEGFELVEARVTIEPRAGAATDVKDLHPLVGRMASPTAARGPPNSGIDKMRPRCFVSIPALSASNLRLSLDADRRLSR